MDLLRKSMLIWMIVGIIFVSVIICLIFLLINKCISRSAGKHRISQLHRGKDFNVRSNKYQETNLKPTIPPLPPRTQFLTEEAQSYENLTEIPDYEQSTPDYEQDKHDYEESTPDYEQDKHDYEQSMLDYEQDMDYVKVEDEVRILCSSPPYKDPDPAADDASTEDYDDIGGEDKDQGEDYDDVG